MTGEEDGEEALWRNRTARRTFNLSLRAVSATTRRVGDASETVNQWIKQPIDQFVASHPHDYQVHE